jgi:hypothetical protein
VSSGSIPGTMPYSPEIFKVATIAREKLAREAAQPDHNLHILVSHANLLDLLLIELTRPTDSQISAHELSLMESQFDITASDMIAAADPGNESIPLRNAAVNEKKEIEFIASTADSNALVPPVLFHDDDDSDSESSGSDAYTDDSDEEYSFAYFTTEVVPESPASRTHSSISEDGVEDLKRLGLHRSPSVLGLSKRNIG